MNCPKCSAGLYCLRSDRIILGDEKRIRRSKNRSSIRPLITESRERTYGCPKCHRRYHSVEILLPKSYMIKPLPESKLKELEMEIVKS